MTAVQPKPLNPTSDAIPSAQRPVPWGWWDLVCVLGLATGYLVFARLLTSAQWPLHFDAFRDLAGMQNLLAGHWWCDPTLRDFPPWYPPLFVWLYGSLAKLFHLEPHIVTSSSHYWVNVWIPIALYALLRTSVSRLAAFAGPIVLVLTSIWWIAFITIAMPSVQGTLLVILGLWAWHLARRVDGWRFGPSVIVTLAAWFHPIATLILAGTYTLDVVATLLWEPRSQWRAPLRQLVTAGASSLVLASPVLVNLWRLPRINHAPFAYFDQALDAPRYAYQFHVMPAMVIGVMGLVYIAVRRPELRWLLCYFALALAGQLIGYWGHALGQPRLILVPHQFQWHTQLALCIALVVFVDWFLRVASIPHSRWVRISLVVVAGGMVARGLTQHGFPIHAFRDAGRFRAVSGATIDWIRSNTELDDVFVAKPMIGYFTLNAYTGRKLLYSNPGHMNPAADVPARLAAYEQFRLADDPEQLRPLVARYHIDYILVTQQERDEGFYPAVLRADFAQEVFVDPKQGWRIYRVLPPPP